jgi:mannan endo-1,4-beta-mannosidase
MKKTILLLNLLAIYFCGIVNAQNLALNKPSYSSGEAVGWNNLTPFANDGDFNTRWQGTQTPGIAVTGGFADTSWWYVDLGQQYNIEGVKIYWEAAYAVAYTIDVSNDSTNWTTIYTQQNGQGIQEFLLFTPTMARFVRMHSTLGVMEWYPSMWEFEVFEHGKISFDNYDLILDKQIPPYAQFKPVAGNLYTNKIEQVVLTDSILKITGNAGLSTTVAWDTLAIDFEKNYIRNFSTNPVIYMNYKADSAFLVQIDIKKSDGSIVSLIADTVFDSKNLADHWIKLNMPAGELDTILALNINIRLLGNYSVYIKKFNMGKSAPAVKLQFIKPAKGKHFAEDENITARIDAISGKVSFYLENNLIKEVSANPYQVVIPGMKKGYYKLVAKHYNDSAKLQDTAYAYFAVIPTGGTQYRDSTTEQLYRSLKYIAANGFSMFGMQMPTTRGFVRGSTYYDYTKSDCKDIVGSHPAFHEADFSNYGSGPFEEYELMSLRENHKAGAVIGFVYHMGGMHSGSIYVNGDASLPDSKLVHEIVSGDTDRTKNPALDWLYSKFDNMVIPAFKELGFPVLFRPWHEMTGNWFWWGSVNTPADFRKLYQLTVTYLRNHGVRNVLYTWSPNISTDMNFYPGDDYVDILGYDGYQIGVQSYASTSIILRDLSTLTDYAATHDKVAAFTETGLDQTNGYPTKYPDWWTKKLFGPITNNAKAKRLAYIETWCNSGTYWIPYKGCNAVNCDKAIADFVKFYDDPATIFENDMPDMYGYNSNKKDAFIYPDSLVLEEGQSFKVFGGTYANWVMNEKKTWSTGNSAIGTIDPDGLVAALTVGTTSIELTVNDSIKTAIQLIVKKLPVGIDATKDENALKIYPNPVSGSGFNLLFANDGKNAKIELIDIRGMTVKSLYTSQNEIFIGTNGFAGGIYIVKINTGNTVAVKKLLINK